MNTFFIYNIFESSKRLLFSRSAIALSCTGFVLGMGKILQSYSCCVSRNSFCLFPFFKFIPENFKYKLNKRIWIDLKLFIRSLFQAVMDRISLQKVAASQKKIIERRTRRLLLPNFAEGS